MSCKIPQIIWQTYDRKGPRGLIEADDLARPGKMTSLIKALVCRLRIFLESIYDIIFLLEKESPRHFAYDIAQTGVITPSMRCGKEDKHPSGRLNRLIPVVQSRFNKSLTNVSRLFDDKFDLEFDLPTLSRYHPGCGK